MATPLDDDELTELVDANFPRVDLVGKGANGIPRWLIAKQDADSAGLFDPEYVRSLIGKSDLAQPGTETTPMAPGVTLSGSPADIAAFIHQAAVRKESRADLPDSAFAYIEDGGTKEDGKTKPDKLRHFRIDDEKHTRLAVQMLSASPFGDKAKPKVMAAARKYGIDVAKALADAGLDQEEIAKMPDEPIAKDDTGPELDGGVDGLDPTVPLAEPEGDAPGDPADPGSPAWEAIDAATACKWTSILSRARVAIDLLADRELLEAACADPDDQENAWDLQDVCCAIDFSIGVLAPYAVAEQSEADTGTDAMAAIGKAMAGFDGVPMDRIEALAQVAKAGRVLSASNEAEIRSAAASLQKVLAALPAAPVADDSGQPVAKTQEDTVDDTTTDAPAAGAPVAKAGSGPPSAEAQAAANGPVNAGGTTGLGQPRGTGPAAALPGDGPQSSLPGDPPGRTIVKSALRVAVYDASLNLAGLVDPAAILSHVTKADGGDDGEDGAGKTPLQPVFDEAGQLCGVVDPSAIIPVSGTGKKPEPKAGDMTPAPPAAAGTPASGTPDDVAKATQTPSEPTQAEPAPSAHDVLKSFVEEMVGAALDARQPAEDIAKQADVAGLRDQIVALKTRLETVEKQPAAPKVFSNGQVPPAGQMRGQDRPGGLPPQVDVAKALARKAELYAADGPEQARIAKEMQGDAVAQLQLLHSGQRP